MTADHPTALSHPNVVQLGYLRQILEAQVGDLSEEEALFQPPEGGNCANFVLGHITVSRNEMLELVGLPASWEPGARARYERGSEPIAGPGPGVLPFAELLRLHEETQAPLVERIVAMSEAELAVRVPWFGGDLDKQGVLAGYLFHEAYHLGQLGLIRRLLGKPSALGA